jgi:hypothetical protein
VCVCAHKQEIRKFSFTFLQFRPIGMSKRERRGRRRKSKVIEICILL